MSQTWHERMSKVLGGEVAAACDFYVRELIAGEWRSVPCPEKGRVILATDFNTLAGYFACDEHILRVACTWEERLFENVD